MRLVFNVAAASIYSQFHWYDAQNNYSRPWCIGSSTLELEKFLISYQWNNHNSLSLFAIFCYICILGLPQLMWFQVLIMQEIVYSYVFPDIKPSLTVNSNTYNFTLCPRKSNVTNTSESCVTLYKTSAFYLSPS